MGYLVGLYALCCTLGFGPLTLIHPSSLVHLPFLAGSGTKRLWSLNALTYALIRAHKLIH